MSLSSYPEDLCITRNENDDWRRAEENDLRSQKDIRYFNPYTTATPSFLYSFAIRKNSPVRCDRDARTFHHEPLNRV